MGDLRDFGGMLFKRADFPLAGYVAVTREALESAFPDGATTVGARYSLAASVEYGTLDPKPAIEVPVTPEMQNAGGNAANDICFSIFMARWNSQDAEQIAVAAYRAMAALAPDALDRANAMPSGSAMINSLCDEVAALKAEGERNNRQWVEAAEAAHVVAMTLDASNQLLRDEIAALTAEKNQLHDALAQRPAVTNPQPFVRSPFRDFPGDPRRIGG